MVNKPKMDDTLKADFCIEIQYKKESENPSRVFRSMSELIDSFQRIDQHLVKAIDVNTETILLLEDIEAGSIKVWLRDLLRAIPDDAVYHLDWKPIVGQYLVKAKKFIINFLENKTTITNIDEIRPLEDEIYKLAEETKVRWLPAYTRIQPRQLLEGMKDISASLSHLTGEDSARYIVPNEPETKFNLTFNLAPESIEDLIAKETLSSESEMLLKVKKPDYLSESMWDFRHGTSTISASILDREWLEKFQSRKVDVRPQDFIRARVGISYKYDQDGELIATHYNILKVIEVIFAPDQAQPNMFEDRENQ
jgi:hypothetical protein